MSNLVWTNKIRLFCHPPRPPRPQPRPALPGYHTRRATNPDPHCLVTTPATPPTSTRAASLPHPPLSQPRPMPPGYPTRRNRNPDPSCQVTPDLPARDIHDQLPGDPMRTHRVIGLGNRIQCKTSVIQQR